MKMGMRRSSFVCVPCLGCVVESTGTVGEEHASVTVVEMETAMLRCRTALNDSVWWNVRTELMGRRSDIYRAGTYVEPFSNTGRYNVSYEGGVYSLIIINVTVTDAGEYQCVGKAGMGNRISTFLKVKG
jgi:Immunoglobulin V-set domain